MSTFNFDNIRMMSPKSSKVSFNTRGVNRTFNKTRSFNKKSPNRTFDARNRTFRGNANLTQTFNMENPNQTFDIPARNQTYNLPAANQTFNVGNPNQTFDIPARNQTYNLPATNQTYNVGNPNQTFDIPDRNQNYNLLAANQTFDVSNAQNPMNQTFNMQNQIMRPEPSPIYFSSEQKKLLDKVEVVCTEIRSFIMSIYKFFCNNQNCNWDAIYTLIGEIDLTTQSMINEIFLQQLRIDNEKEVTYESSNQSSQKFMPSTFDSQTSSYEDSTEPDSLEEGLSNINRTQNNLGRFNNFENPNLLTDSQE